LGAARCLEHRLLHPQRIAKLAVLNVPHPSVLRKFSARVRVKSSAAGHVLLQLPWLPKSFSPLSISALAPLASPSSRPGTFSAEDSRQYRAAWSQPGALTAMIIGTAPSSAPLQIRTNRPRPTRILWASTTISPDRNGSRKPALLHERRALHLRQRSHWLSTKNRCGLGIVD